MEESKEEVTYQEFQKIFRKFPKGADLHSHFSSAVCYIDILDDIEESHIYQEVHFNKFKHELLVIDTKFARKNREKFTPYFKNERNVKDMIAKHVQDKVRQGTQKKSADYQEEEHEEEEFDADKAFLEYKTLGNIFYNIIKSDVLYENYIDLIFNNMKENHINYQELRLKLDLKDRKSIVPSKNIIDYVFKKNHEQKNRKIKIILQFGRWAKNLKEQLMEVFNYFKDKKRLRSEIIGIDFTGQEINELDPTVMEDKEILSNLKAFNWQFYNHAGEMIVKKEIQEDFGWEYNHNLKNVLYLLEQHQQENKECYSRKIRIGHGIVFLQYLTYLESHLDQEDNKEKYEKYMKLSENVCFEVCPFSNLHFYGGQLDKEIYEKFADRICICTDDQNKMDRNLSDTYLYLFTSLNVSYESIIQFTKNSLAYAGIEEEDLKILKEEFENSLKDWEESYKEKVLKGKQQGNLDFVQEKPWWYTRNYKKVRI